MCFHQKWSLWEMEDSLLWGKLQTRGNPFKLFSARFPSSFFSETLIFENVDNYFRELAFCQKNIRLVCMESVGIRQPGDSSHHAFHLHSSLKHWFLENVDNYFRELAFRQKNIRLVCMESVGVRQSGSAAPFLNGVGSLTMFIIFHQSCKFCISENVFSPGKRRKTLSCFTEPTPLEKWRKDSKVATGKNGAKLDKSVHFSGAQNTLSPSFLSGTSACVSNPLWFFDTGFVLVYLPVLRNIFQTWHCLLSVFSR